MSGNCSTRDGRSRVAAPSNPHITWTLKLPTDSTQSLGPSAIATDASGRAYVAVTGNLGEGVAQLVCVDTSAGKIVWQKPISPDDETTTPVVLAAGGVDLFAYAMNEDAVFTFDPATGASTDTNFGVSLYDAPANLAVGADGSLYVAHQDGIGTAQTTSYVSRVSPAGTVLWTSVDLGTLVATSPLGGDLNLSDIALGQNDVVTLLASGVGSTGPWSAFIALDPNTGAVRSSFADGPTADVGRPIVRPDGSLVYLGVSATAAGMSIVDPVTLRQRAAVGLGASASEIFGVTEAGMVLLGRTGGAGGLDLSLIHDDSTVVWSFPSVRGVTVARGDTVVTFGASISALDGATGIPTWTLAPPSPSCILDLALTSEGSLVGLQCDGTVFGAAD